MGPPANRTRRALTAMLLLSLAVPSTHAQQAPAAADPALEPVIEDVTTTSVLELSKMEEIVEVLRNAYAAGIALRTAIRGGECTRIEPHCAPLYFAQDVILGPWNVTRLLRATQEFSDPDVLTIVRPRAYETPALPPAGVLSPEIVSFAEYAFEQQVALYEQLEAWQITLERYSAAAGSGNESASAAQRRALDEYSSKVSTAAAAVSAASIEFLERITPLIGSFAASVATDATDAARDELRDNGFGPEWHERFSAFGIQQTDRTRLLEELFAFSSEASVDLVEALTMVARGYDTLADITSVPADSSGNLRPLADAGPNQALPTGDAGVALVTLSGTRSTDPEAGVLQYFWTGASVAERGATATISLPPGTHHIALTVDDGRGGRDVDIITVTVGDGGAPIISRLAAMPAVLWPPNRQLVLVNVDVTVVDNDDPAPFCQVISVGVNTPPSTAANAEPDMVLNGSLTVLLRADPSGATPSRAYTVTVQCTDKSNHSAIESIMVPVSH